MLRRGFGGSRPVVGIVLGIGLLVLCGSALAQGNYMGDEEFCALCHQDKYDSYMLSGHPYKIVHTGGEVPSADTWPHTPVPPLPLDPVLPNGWADVEYVIGNFFWKARFINKNGYIHTGDKVQLNVQDGTWSAYHAGEVKVFDCGRCHTTGYDPAGGNQNGLPGLIGTWAQDGIRCEACHGAGGPHLGGEGAKDCKDCHYRDAQFRMPWQKGFMRHHQQAEDLAHSPHKGLHCTECHDPHKSVVYGLGGVTKQCTDCHQKRVRGTMGDIGLECIDCHMAFIGKSAVAANAYTGDVRGHLFRIMTQPIAAADNVTGGFWNQDANGDASITLDYACKQCHAAMTLEQAAAVAKTIHRTTEMLDLTVNGEDQLQVVKKADPVAVDFSIYAGDKNGMTAQWWVLCQGPKGWSSWNGKKWVRGFRPWRKSAPLVDVPTQNVLDSRKLGPGHYTYWLCVYPTDDSENVVGVPLYVKRR